MLSLLDGLGTLCLWMQHTRMLMETGGPKSERGQLSQTPHRTTVGMPISHRECAAHHVFWLQDTAVAKRIFLLPQCFLTFREFTLLHVFPSLVRCVLSGPMRFEYHEDSKRWLNTRDGETELRAILATEMSEKCGVSL